MVGLCRLIGIVFSSFFFSWRLFDNGLMGMMIFRNDLSVFKVFFDEVVGLDKC